MKRKINKPSLVGIVCAIILLVVILPARSERANNVDTYQEWGVVTKDATYFYLSENITGQTVGIDYKCTVSIGRTCTIQTDDGYLLPNGSGFKVSRANATILIDNAQFDTNP